MGHGLQQSSCNMRPFLEAGWRCALLLKALQTHQAVQSLVCMWHRSPLCILDIRLQTQPPARPLERCSVPALRALLSYSVLAACSRAHGSLIQI